MRCQGCHIIKPEFALMDCPMCKTKLCGQCYEQHRKLVTPQRRPDPPLPKTLQPAGRYK